MTQLSSVLLTILGIGFLIFIHEAGHYICARLAGVRVLVFSLGFGPRLFGFVKGDTDYRFSLVPLGGYVRVAGEDPTQPSYDESGLHAKSVPARALFFTGGVVMNFLFAFVAFPIAFKSGVEFTAPVVGDVVEGHAAWEQDLRPGDRVLEVNGKSMYSFENMQVEIALAGDRDIPLLIERGGNTLTKVVRPRYDSVAGLFRIGIAQPMEPVSVGKVDESSPGYAAGLREGDQLLILNGEPVTPRVLEDYAARTDLSGEPVELQVSSDERGLRTISYVPEIVERDRGRIGVTLASRRVVGLRRGLAAVEELGIRRGDHIIKVDGRRFTGGSFAPFAEGPAELEVVYERRGVADPIVRSASIAPEQRAQLDDFIGLGSDEIGVVVVPHPGSPAERAGIPAGAEIVSVGGRRVHAWADLVDVVRDTKPGETLAVKLRDDPTSYAVSPSYRVTDLAVAGRIAPIRELYREETISGAIGAGMVCSIDLIKSLYVTLKKLFTGEVAAKNLGGIITISRASYLFAQRGWEVFLYFLALLSINLAVINLLPIPVLDGGHLLFVLIEGIKGSPVDPKVLNYSQILGLVFIVALLVFVTYNDILRI